MPWPGSHGYPHGVTVTVSATANFGWVLDYWSGDCSGEESETSVLMNGSKTCVANFTCGVVIPGTYAGKVFIYGELAPPGTAITAYIDGLWWGLCFTNGDGEYVCDVPLYLPEDPPCFEGGWILFYADGLLCDPVGVEWEPWLQEVDLYCY